MRPLQVLSPFRRKSNEDPRDPRLGPAAAPPAPAGSAPQAAPAHDPETVDLLEADVLKAIRSVTQAIASASQEVQGTGDDLGDIHVHVSELASAGMGAASQTVALAASTEELAATSGEITGAWTMPPSRSAMRWPPHAMPTP
jgi:methyl-accepting chemotaxis protein